MFHTIDKALRGQMATRCTLCTTLMSLSMRHPTHVLMSLLTRNSAPIFITIVVLVFIRAGFFAGHNYPESTIYHALKIPPTEATWFTKPARFLLSSNKRRTVTQHPIPKLMDE